MQIIGKEYQLVYDPALPQTYDSLPFSSSDVIALVPKVKCMDIVNKDSKTYIQSGKAQMSISPELGSELLSQGMNILFQIQGPMNIETASCMSKLGSIHLKYGDFTQAINLQSRASLIFRELLGEVHPQVAFSYTSLEFIVPSSKQFKTYRT